MSAFEQLPPDQRATLSLLLRRHKSYAEVAQLLEIAPRAVHDRAHAALAVLAPALARALTPELREEVGDYLLGQQQPDAAGQTRARIAASAPAREWAKALAVELVHVTADQLPEIPEHDPAAAGDLPAPSLAPRDEGSEETQRPRVSRRGGIAVLGLIAVVVIVAIVIVVSSGKGSGTSTGSGKPAAAASEEEATKGTGEGGSESKTETSTSSTSSIHAEAEIALTAPGQGKATGGVAIVSEKGHRAFIIAAEHLEPPKGFEYVAWLLNSKGEAHALGLAEVSKEGKLYAGNALPENVSSYDLFELTRDTGSKPAKPGKVVLEGALELS